MKKVLLIIGIIVIVAIVAFLMFGNNMVNQDESSSRVGFSIMDYLPFGTNDGGQFNISTKTDTENNVVAPNQDVSINKPIPRLRKISNEPVAGAVIFNIGSSSVVRFVEKGTGNVYEARSDSHLIQRLTNTTIPRIIRAFWLPDGSGFIGQTLTEDMSVVETNFIKLKKNTATTTESLTQYSTIKSSLPTSIKEIAIRPDGLKIFYYTSIPSASFWFISNPDGTNSVSLNSHPITEWIPEWINENTIIMQTKGSIQAKSYLYSFNVSNKTMKKVGVSLYGMSSNTNNDSSFSLVSSGLSLFLIDNKNISSTKIETETLAEKCVWTKKEVLFAYCAIPISSISGVFPDDWYKGVAQSEDSIVKIDLKNNVFYPTSYLSEESSEKIDVVDISISKDDSHIIFRNKIDGYLWMLRIAE